MTSATTLDASALLATARRAKVDEDRAAAEMLAAALAWAEMHATEDADVAATFGDSPVLIAGEGAPMVRWDAVAEFAAVIGRSTASGRHLIGQALELAHRLPRTWQRIQAGTLPAWRGRLVAENTLALSPEAAEYVDTQIAPFAHRTTVAETQRLVDEAVARFMPEVAQQRLDDSADRRHVTFDHRQISYAGTTAMTAELDLLDALELDARVTAEAAALKDLGSEESLDARRATALGNLARSQQTLPTPTDLVVHVHLDPAGQARVENADQRPISVEQVKVWCSTSRVTVKPVIDLAKPISTTAYEVPDRIRERLILRDRTCVFPHCPRNARSCDADHVVGFDEGGATSTDNLAPLCRHHHNLKTHAGWSYTPLEPGVYLWRSPHGYQFIRDRHGTEIVTPRPVAPPGRARRLDERDER